MRVLQRQQGLKKETKEQREQQPSKTEETQQQDIG